AYEKTGKKGSEVPAQLREAASELPPGRLIEAVDDKGYEWLVCLIKAGLAKSGTYYPPEVLREAAPLFEGVRGFNRSDDDHLADKGASVQNIVGWHDQVQFQEADGGRLVSHFHVAADAPWLALKMRQAWDKGKYDLLGFSIVADGRATLRRQSGRMVRYAEAITKVDAVDPVLNASAGGQIIRMIQADGAGTGGEQEMKFLERLIQMIEAERPELLKGKNKDNLQEDEVMTLFREAMQGKAPAKDPAKAKEEDDLLKQVEVRLKEAEDRAKAAEERFKEAECRNLLAGKLTSCGLPEITLAKIRKDFTARKVFVEADLDQAITDEREYLAKFHEASGLPGLGRATAGPDERDKVLRALEGFFFAEDLKIGDQKVPRFISIREAYTKITGDHQVTGRVEDAVNLKKYAFREALGTDSWAQIFGVSMTRRLLAEYNLPQYQAWRLIVSDIVPVNDFRENLRLRVGGYGDLPEVAEHGNYEELTSPNDEEVGYSVSTRGGLEFLSRRMIINDDVGAVRRIPVNLARAAARTLFKAVFNIFVTNPTMPYDSKALFIDDDHHNLGSTALSAAALTATRIAMRSQTSYDGNDILGLVPRYLLVPNELEEMAMLLTKSGKKVPASGEATDLPTLHTGMDFIVLDFWTDATDWVAVADPRDIPTIEVGFLQGREEPEVFVQDQPTQGYMFNSDKLAYKIRHEWGLAALEHRGFYKHVVAN
ncbi:MAG: phage major capsid protein, partial [Desulfobaccales bacterium]